MKISKQLKVLLFISIICILGHLFSPPSWEYAHDFLFKFTYLPIILSAIWYGRWFAIQISTVFCLVYLFHIYTQLYHTHHHIFSILLDLSLYFLVAWVTGHLSDLQKKSAHHLEKTYIALKEKTALLLEFEKNALKNERLKVMGELAGTIAHEVRTPLSGIQGAVEIVVNEKSDSDTKKKFTNTIFQEIQRINQVVSGFLKIGQKDNSQMKSLNLKDFFSDCLTLLIPVLKKKNIELSINIPENLTVNTHHDQFKQVIINLVMNSVAALSKEPRHIQLKAWDDDINVFISIEDNGKGVPEKLKEVIFNAFESDSKDGSGLGLYLSKNIIQSFQGDLTLYQSEPGHTEFRIQLPKVYDKQTN